MRLIGNCRRCHRIRYVRVSDQELAFARRILAAGICRDVPTGICLDCEREAAPGRSITPAPAPPREAT